MKTPYKATPQFIIDDMPEFRGDVLRVYGIDENVPSFTSNKADGHPGKIVVFGDVRLRNKILRLLNACTLKN